uniref:Uncharacterized protein n=1 Tax=Arundo donax TaxID=35708 RepID=A0A0A8ZPU9_ARUDO
MARAVSRKMHCCIPVAEDQSGGAARPTTASGGKAPASRATAEKWLNYFVRTIALAERIGNGLGTLAFTWATVVVLGGFSTDLGEDFWYATAIVFLEALRVFSRESRSDDELLFKTTGGISLKRVRLITEIPYYLNAGIVIVCLYGIMLFFLMVYLAFPRPPLPPEYQFLLMAALLALVSMVRLPSVVECMKENLVLQFIPLVAVLTFGGALLGAGVSPRQVALDTTPLLVGCLQYNVIQFILRTAKVPARLPLCIRKFGSLIFPIWIIISVMLTLGPMGILLLLGTVLVGNIQIPVALARIALSSLRLSNKDILKTNNVHLAPALRIFYSMVLAQGTLYILACFFESTLSLSLRRSLAQKCDLAYKKGAQSIDLYYEHAYDKCMQGGVLSPEDLNLVRFAVASLDSNSSDKKLAAVRILYSLLQKEDSRKEVVSNITTSTKAVATLISLMGWTTPEDECTRIRLFAAKVTAEIADDIKIVGITGTIQIVSSLLDAKNQPVGVRQDSNAKDTPSQLVVGNSRFRRLLQGVKKIMSQEDSGKKEEEEAPLTDNDFLPILGMVILEKLAYDLDNCAEINRATGLIPKIIGFMSYTPHTTKISEPQQNLIMISSLKLVAKLASTNEEIGTTLRRKILEQPFLLSNLVAILEDSSNHLEQWELAVIIIAKLAIDEKTSHEIGSFQLIIPKLMQAFLGRQKPSNTYYDRSVRMVAGEALSKLSMENSGYCLAILEEKGYNLLEDLTNMLQEDEYTYVAASLIWSLCVHSSNKLLCCPQSSEQLSSALRAALVKMMDAQGKQLEALIGLALQICNVIPKPFADELESQQTNRAGIVQKLVSTLNSSKIQSPEYPRMRRVVVEMTISIVRLCPSYATIFREQEMMEALSKVERTSKIERVRPSKAEKDGVLSSNMGALLDSSEPLPVLVAKAKGLIDSAPPTPGGQPGRDHA